MTSAGEIRPKPLVAKIVVSPGDPAEAVAIQAAYAEMVYHYTSAAAMLSIVTNRKLWLTNVDFVNDQLEFRQPIDRFRQMIERRDLYMPWTAGESPKYFEAFKIQMSSNWLAYVACFSKTGDSLSQFRLYGQGTGYSLGLTRSYLQRLAGTISDGPMPYQHGAGIVDCDYSEQSLHRWCDTWARNFFAAAKKFDNESLGPAELWQEIGSKTDLFEQRIMAQMRFKSRQFEVEQEVRFYKFGNAGKLCWRASRAGNYIIPYLEVDLPNDSSRAKMTPGPNHEEFLANQSASQLIQAAKAYGTAWEIGLTGMAQSGFRYGL